MTKFLILVSLFVGFSTFADEIYSSHTISCHMVEGAGPVQSYSAVMTTHENVQPLEIVDVTLREPSSYSNSPAYREAMFLPNPLKTKSTVTAIGHGVTIVIDVSGPKLTASLVDNNWHQTYSCKE